MKVSVLYHVHVPGLMIYDVKLIGMYTSRQLAEEAWERVKQQPGFKQCPEGVIICDTIVNRDGWINGFTNELDWMQPDYSIPDSAENLPQELHKVYRLDFQKEPEYDMDIEK